MDTSEAAKAFAALGYKGRLEIVELLLATGEEGLSAGEIGGRIDARQNSASSQLRVLTEAKVIVQERRGRQMFYRVNRELFADLARFFIP